MVAHGATCPVELPASLSRRIKTLSLNEGSTSFISLLAAFKATLYQYTGNTDIIVTSPMANRHHLEVEPSFKLRVLIRLLRNGARPEIRYPPSDEIAFNGRPYCAAIKMSEPRL